KSARANLETLDGVNFFSVGPTVRFRSVHRFAASSHAAGPPTPLHVSRDLPRDHEREFEGVYWFGHVDLVTRGQGADAVFGAGVGGQGDGGGPGSLLPLPFPELADEFVAIRARHAYVRDQ